MVGATFDGATTTWTVETDAGDRHTARFVVAATGCLSSANLPDIPGRDSFRGPTHHTGRWPHEGVDFTGQRVAVIGTGSSAVQAIPIIAEQAADLTVFQRTATYAVPAHNEPLPADLQAAAKARYREVRAANRMAAVGFGALSTLGPPAGATAEVDPHERERVLDERWGDGGLVAPRPDAPCVGAGFFGRGLGQGGARKNDCDSVS